MPCTSHSPQLPPVVGGRKVWWGGDTHREGGGGWEGLGWSSLGRKEMGPLCQPGLHPYPGGCQSLVAHLGPSAAISKVSLRPVTSQCAEEMTSRGGRQQPGAR